MRDGGACTSGAFSDAEMELEMDAALQDAWLNTRTAGGCNGEHQLQGLRRHDVRTAVLPVV